VPERSTYVDTHGAMANRGYALRQGGAPGVRTGNGEGSAEARKAGRSLIFQCPTCYAMVDLRAATRAAGCAGREITAGDGCLGCSTHCAPGAYIATQIDRIAALQRGERTLVRIPISMKDDDGERKRRLHIGTRSLCMRAETALRTVAKAAGIPYPEA
jgi:hypothetical protein